MRPLIKNVIVAVNGNQSSINAAMYAIMLTKQLDLNLKVVYVVDTATIKFLHASKFLISEEKNDYEEDLRRDGKVCLNLIENLAKSKGVKIETVMLEGGVCSSVLGYAEKIQADMIMIGGHDEKGKYIQSNESRASIHSKARAEMVNFAKCPVMVVHKPDIEALFKIF